MRRKASMKHMLLRWNGTEESPVATQEGNQGLVMDQRESLLVRAVWPGIMVGSEAAA